MDAPLPIDKALQRQLDLYLLRNEQVRASLLAGLFGVLMAFLAVRLLLTLGAPANAAQLLLRLWIPLLVAGALLVFELLYRRFVIGRLQAQEPVPNALWYLATCLEFGALVAAFYFPQQVRPSPSLAGLPVQVAILLIFVMVSAFRLHFFITAFTGLLAGICYLIFVYMAHGIPTATTTGVAAPLAEEYFWVAGFIVGGGIIAGFIAMQVRRQTLRLARTLRERQRLEEEIERIAEEEQRRIGRDLHDGLGSHLTGVSMLCRGLARRLDKGQAIRQEEMEEVARMVEDAVAQARLLARGLNPVKLDDGGLPAALRALAAGVQTVSGITCTFSTEGHVVNLAPRTADQLYRIAQEAVNNAAKHAQATHIDISLVGTADQLELAVRDDGIGLSGATTSDGFGLKSMQHRATLTGARFSIDDAPGGGTVVRFVRPQRHEPP